MKRTKKSRIMNREIGNETVYKMNASKRMDPELIKKINSNLAKGKYAIHYDPGALRDWQWEIILKNESEEEARVF